MIQVAVDYYLNLLLVWVLVLFFGADADAALLK